MATNVGIEIEYLSKGARNAGIVNHSVTAPSRSAGTQILDRPSDAILADQGTVEISVPMPGPLVLTSAPTVHDGMDGQRLTLINVGPGAVGLSGAVALPDSNLRLPSATVTLGEGDVLTLHFSAAFGDWVATGLVYNGG